MSLTHEPWRPLAPVAGPGSALAAALEPVGPTALSPAASAVLDALLAPGGGSGAPLFADADGAAWRRAREADGLAPDLLAALAAGRTGVVVTGQQPGFLGGPLLTLHKLATAVALAAARTAAGRPTVAVFWSGDDDDDLVEALAPAGWDPDLGTLVRAEGRGAARSGHVVRAQLGPLPARRWCAPGAALLARLAARDRDGKLASGLAALWDLALAEDWDWARLNVAALRRLFAGYPLVVVRGNDPALHEAGAAFYRSLAGRRAELRSLVAAEGAARARAGLPPALSERSLRHHLYTVAEGRRRPLPESGVPDDTANLRPGVLLRSPLQDWLLRPVAVVAGPGEFAYLRELEPLYGALGVVRAPLVPRLFAWVVPAALGAESLPVDDGRGDGADPRVAALAAGVAERAGADLERALREELGLTPVRAELLARNRAVRWERGVAAMARAEAARQRRAPLAAVPAWVLPDGHRQERRLAAVAAAALLGDSVVDTLVAAAAAHLVAGATDDWREYLLRND